jgi:nicotinate-nucleotide pyrophosphorylase
MKVFYSNDFKGHYPVGTAAIVVAESESAAMVYLEEACKRCGLKGFDGTLTELDTEVRAAFILNDGDY